jgi:hypothetical protein
MYIKTWEETNVGGKFIGVALFSVMAVHGPTVGHLPVVLGVTPVSLWQCK